jgi:L-rhamnono-1,4-lactonase
MCKPNLRLPASTGLTTHPDFLDWKSLITTMSSFPSTYMKLSGAFSELPPLSSPSSLEPRPSTSALVDSLQPWTDAVFDSFGPGRIMFGSDWPVCNVGGGGNEVSWRSWREVVEMLLERRGLGKDEKRCVWGGVAERAYKVPI